MNSLDKMEEKMREAPVNSLPDWSECAMRVANSDFIAKRVADGGYGPDADSKLATQIHRFIYEYDDADAYRSAWFLHRLELLLEETKQSAIAHANTQHSKIIEDYDRLAKLCEKQAEEIEREKLYSSMLFDKNNAANATIAMLRDVLKDCQQGELFGIADALANTQAAADAFMVEHDAEIVAPLQYKIDQLMLEYCPDDMTQEQLVNWGNHQIPVDAKTQALIDRASANRKDE